MFSDRIPLAERLAAYERLARLVPERNSVTEDPAPDEELVVREISGWGVHANSNVREEVQVRWWGWSGFTWEPAAQMRKRVPIIWDYYVYHGNHDHVSAVAKRVQSLKVARPSTTTSGRVLGRKSGPGAVGMSEPHQRTGNSWPDLPFSAIDLSELFDKIVVQERERAAKGAGEKRALCGSVDQVKVKRFKKGPTNL